MGRLAQAAAERKAVTVVRDDTIIGRLLRYADDEDRTDLLALLADTEGWPAPDLADFINEHFPSIGTVSNDLVSKWRREKLSRHV